MTLDELLAAFRAEIHLPSLVGPLAVLAAAAVNLRLPGQPIWLMLVGPPSGGKSRLIRSLEEVPRAHAESTFTRAALLTLGRDRQLGGVLARMGGVTEDTGQALTVRGAQGLLLVDDFTAMLTGTDALDLVREVYDGKVRRALGAGGGISLRFEDGRVGLIGGVTEAVESHREELGAKGERFAYVALPPLQARDREIIGHRAARAAQDAGVQGRLNSAVAEFIADLPNLSQTPVTDAEYDRLVAAADLAAMARSTVQRDTYHRDVILVPAPEAPGRLAGVFAQLWRGLRLIGAEPADAGAVLRAATVGCLPSTRRAVLLGLLEASRALRPFDLARQLRIPDATLRRAIEDLAAHQVVDVEDDRHGQTWWTASSWTQTRWAQAFGPTVPDRPALSLVPAHPLDGLHRLEQSGPCQRCGQPAALGNRAGPLHPYCESGVSP